MANNRVGGIAFLSVDGEQYPIRGKWKHNIAATKREGVAGQDGVHGYKEMPKVPMMQGDVTSLGSLSIEQVHKITDATITLEEATGKVYILRNAWCAEEIEVDTEEGSFSLKFEGMSGEEVLPNVV